MKLIEEALAFELISTFGIFPDFGDKELFIHWLTKAGLLQEAEELSALDEDEFYELFSYFIENHQSNFIH